MLQLKTFLQSLTPIKEETWNDVQQLFGKAVLKKGDRFCDYDSVSRDFGLLTSGVIRGFYRTDKGNEYNKHFFTAPSIIGGYTSLITGKPNMVIQEALTDCVMLVANYAAFVKLYDNHADLERAGRIFAERYFVEKENKEFEIITYDAEKRYQLFQQRYPQLEQLISQYHIASYLGISATQLSRIRKKINDR
jgi:CRP-like cAMP-binding protein